ncbi:MAG: hypothetical protein HY543_08020 [Deltaproteobacteria bacterium]|nr:hypothetical protein [Deltaproteobacteria bacterium]
MKRHVLRILGVVLLGIASGAAQAAGPWYVDMAGSGKSYTWPGGQLAWSIEQEDLGPIPFETVHKIVQNAFATWKNAGLFLPGLFFVPTTTIKPVELGATAEPVDAGNVSSYFQTKVTIIMDPDGKILESEGLDPSSILAATFINYNTFDASGLTIRHGITILSGVALEGTDPAAGDDDPSIQFLRSFVTHEIGHLLNLDHTALGQDIYGELGADANLAKAIPTMYPILLRSGAQATLKMDDVVGISSLAPAADFTQRFCAAGGKLLGSNGKGYQGALVIARSKQDPYTETVSAVTGARFPRNTADGSYLLRGLKPGVKYTVEYTEISPNFTGGSALQPYGGLDGELPRTGFGQGKMTAGGGKLKEVSCDKGGQMILMDDVHLKVEATGEAAKGSVLPATDPSKSPAVNEGSGSGGCSLLIR